MLSLEFALLIIIIPMVGGMGTVLGPILGAGILIPLAEYTRTVFGGGGRGVHLLLYGLIIVLIALYEPKGLIGIVRKMRKGLKKESKDEYEMVQSIQGKDET